MAAATAVRSAGWLRWLRGERRVVTLVLTGRGTVGLGGVAGARCPHEAPMANLNGNLVVVARLARG